MSDEQLSQYAGVLLSLLLAYIPGVSSWYDGKDTKTKAGIMAGLLAMVAVSVYGLDCLGWVVDLGVSCTQVGAIELVKLFVSALISNQATFVLGVRPFKK